MAIELHCQCGQRFSVPDEKAGTLATCAACGATIYVVAPAAAAPDQSLALDRSETALSVVERDLVSPEMLALREERVPGWPTAEPTDTGEAEDAGGPAGGLTAADDAAARQTSETIVETGIGEVVAGPEGSSLDHAADTGGYSISVDEQVEVQRRHYERCPQCDVPLEPDAVICTNCGFNLETGERVALVSVQERDQDAAERAAEVSRGVVDFLAAGVVKLRYAVVGLALLIAAAVVITRFVGRHERRSAYLSEISGGGLVGGWWQAAQKAVQEEAFDLERRTQEEIQLAMMKLNNEPEAERGFFCQESQAAAQLAFLDAREARVERHDPVRAQQLLEAIEVLYGPMEPWGRRAREELQRLRATRVDATPATRPASRPVSLGDE